MVTMLPDYIDPAVKSDAEKKLFRNFKKYKTDDDIIILHSLGIAEHVNKIFGEIDFVVICKEGILCIEVKGGQVDRIGGKWRFTNRYGAMTEKVEGPFQQVQGNMHSLRSYLKKRLGTDDPIFRCQFASAVIIPDMNFSLTGADIIRDILFDNSFQWNLQTIIEKSFSYWHDQMIDKHGFGGGDLELSEMNRAADLLRGDFRLIPLMRSKIDQIDKELGVMTEEQYDILSSLSDNDRLLIRGMAGSGKTLLAMEQARRAYWEGKSVLFLCFNSAIARYVKYKFDYETVDITVSTIHALMQKECGTEPSDDYPSEYFSKTLPEAFLNLPTVSDYDLVIVDEAQDLLNRKYISCINRLVKEGLDNGCWGLYYDANQNIFQDNKELDECISIMKKKYAVSYELTVNCRNTSQIVRANNMISNISTSGRSRVEGDEAEYICYSSKDEEFQLILRTLQELSNEGIRGNEIVILSRYKPDNPLNCLHGRSMYRPYKLKVYGDVWTRNNDEVQFSTIASFKGLESKVILIVDVDRMDDSFSRLLHYVAVSRARSNLYFFYDKTVEDIRQQMIIKAYTGMR